MKTPRFYRNSRLFDFVSIFMVLFLSGFLGTCYDSLLYGSEPISQQYLDAAEDYHFTIVYKLDESTGMTGTPLTGYRLEKEFTRFFDALELLPMDFIEKIKLKKVVIVKGLKIEGNDCDGASNDGLLALDEGFERSTVYHEMFHILDPFMDPKSDPEWNKCNPKGFVYTGNDFYAANLDSSKKRQVKKEKSDPNLLLHFVSEHAASFDYEDRAETFSFMIDEGKNFLKRAESSPSINAKMNYIIELTDRLGILNQAFWKKCLSKRPKPMED
ncbi:MAG: hypothetical protein PHQ75_02790 [Thermoguttaceae bacterium]|nr:hypothetical protein [Thermoguttaceae bacterium]